MSEILSPLAADFTLFGGADAVLLIHGFTGSPAHMLPLGRALQEAGFTVRGIRLKGHGTTLSDMRTASCEDWLTEAREAYEALSDAFRSVSVAGLSMGGLISLILAEEKEPACCVTLAAPMRIRNPLSFAAPALAKIKPEIKKRRSASPPFLNQDYAVGYSKIPTASVASLNRLIRMAKNSLHAVRCPLMCAQALKDPAIASSSADTILKGVSSSVTEKLTLQQPHHLITIGPETGTLFPAVCRFITEAVSKEII